VVNVYGRSLSDRFRHMYLPARRDVVFNLEHAEGDRAILTESAIDVLSLVALGIENAVSSLSARLTRRQFDVLAARFARVDIAFDGDEAGVQGGAATAGALRERGVDCKVVPMPNGSDVNSLVTGGMTRGDFGSLVRTSS
jgi:DNA primase